jgi:hypothetical protein
MGTGMRGNWVDGVGAKDRTWLDATHIGFGFGKTVQKQRKEKRNKRSKLSRIDVQNRRDFPSMVCSRESFGLFSSLSRCDVDEQPQLHFDFDLRIIADSLVQKSGQLRRQPRCP